MFSYRTKKANTGRVESVGRQSADRLRRVGAEAAGPHRSDALPREANRTRWYSFLLNDSPFRIDFVALHVFLFASASSFHSLPINFHFSEELI